ncbi:MAG: esterase-like activity of phytase family protein [Actinophytocola sp.]|uniref:esterase-like activity of phytase family protein n=1 Tax=Actinophytocola sp. TaxID=1872138 RepID=UPI003C7449CE
MVNATSNTASVRTRRRIRRVAAIAMLAGLGLFIPGTAAHAVLPLCPPSGALIGFSDALDGAVLDGQPVSELSALALDVRSGGFISVSDEVPTLFFLRHPASPEATRTVPLRAADGTPFTGDTFDGEGVAVLPDGRVLVSSELEPSIRIFTRGGLQVGSLEVPARFQVAPAGQARANGTLEGLTISPSGKYVYAAMEAPLSGDAPATGESLIRRILVYRADGHGGYALLKQIGYATEPGHRISEIGAYADGKFVIQEIAFTPGVGVDDLLYAVTGALGAVDVTGVPNLATAPASAIVEKSLAIHVNECPPGGATHPGPQANPLLDNYEGLWVGAPLGAGPAVLEIISDNNSNPTQVTRLVRFAALLP